MLYHANTLVKFKILLFFSIFFNSCTTNIGTLTIASTEEVDLKSEYVNIGVVKGEYRVPWFIIPMRDLRRFDKAIDNSLRKNKISYITDLKINEEKIILYLFGVVIIRVEGFGWKKVESKYDPETGNIIN
tara:strand:- start:143 stop:532 length:390 start_codon:yes stop_codon:yes gene_type:complete